MRKNEKYKFKTFEKILKAKTNLLTSDNAT